MKLNLTKELIDKGIINKSNEHDWDTNACVLCPVALAAQEAFNNKHIRVDSNFIYLGMSDTPVKLPDKLGEFVKEFDENFPVEKLYTYIGEYEL